MAGGSSSKGYIYIAFASRPVNQLLELALLIVSPITSESSVAPVSHEEEYAQPLGQAALNALHRKGCIGTSTYGYNGHCC